VVLAWPVYTVSRINLSSGSCEAVKDIVYGRVDIHLPNAAIGRDPGIEVRATHKDLAPRLVAGQRVYRVVNVVAQLPHTQARIGGQGLEREIRV